MSYQDVKDKLYHGHRKIANNTYLTLEHYQDIEWIEMKLHGSLIAEFHPGGLQLFSAGYHTRTTKDRLNLALKLARTNMDSVITGRLCDGRYIYQVDYQWYYGNYHIANPKFYDGIKIDYTGKVIGG